MQKAFTLAVAALAAVAFGAPGRSNSKPTHRTGSNRTGSKGLVSRETESPWGGAVQDGQGWYSVTGVLTVPQISGQSSSAAASIWVGIDGDSCDSAILQTGITVYGDGGVETWTEWWKDNEINYSSQISVSAGDQLRMSVYATSATSGNTTIENLTNGQSQSHTFSNQQYSLCQTNAEWIIEDYLSSNARVDFVDFGSLQFTDTAAYGSNGEVTPQGAKIYNVEIDNENKTDCSSDANGVKCTYV